MQHAEEEAVASARAGDPPADPKLGAVYRLSRSLVQQRGHVDEDDTQAFLDAGYPRSALFDVVAQVGHTTMANLAHSISKAPVDPAFAAQKWVAAAPWYRRHLHAFCPPALEERRHDLARRLSVDHLLPMVDEREDRELAVTASHARHL